jgi:hypothetical protein
MIQSRSATQRRWLGCLAARRGRLRVRSRKVPRHGAIHAPVRGRIPPGTPVLAPVRKNPTVLVGSARLQFRLDRRALFGRVGDGGGVLPWLMPSDRAASLLSCRRRGADCTADDAIICIGAGKGRPPIWPPRPPRGPLPKVVIHPPGPSGSQPAANAEIRTCVRESGQCRPAAPPWRWTGGRRVRSARSRHGRTHNLGLPGR